MRDYEKLIYSVTYYEFKTFLFFSIPVRGVTIQKHIRFQSYLHILLYFDVNPGLIMFAKDCINVLSIYHAKLKLNSRNMEITSGAVITPLNEKLFEKNKNVLSSLQ